MSSYRSGLPWLWIVEYLARFHKLPISALHGLIERIPELPNNYDKNTKEMVALRCLEELFSPSNGITNEVLPESRIGFDDSETCEDVLWSILKEISEQGKGGPERLKWDIQFFIMHKRANRNRCALEKLKDVIAGGNHLNAAALRKKSGLMQVDESNRKTGHVSNLSDVSGMCGLRGLDPQGVQVDGDLIPLKNLKDNKLQDGLHNEILLSTKRPKNDLAAGSSGVLMNGHGDMSGYDPCHRYTKKLRLDAAAVDYSVGQTSIDLHANRTLEDSEKIPVVSEVEGCFLAQECQAMDNSDEGIASDMLIQRNKYQEVDFHDNEMESFPSYINPCEGTYSRCSQVDEAGNVEPIATPCKLMTDTKDGFSDESPERNDQSIHLKSLDPLSAEKTQQVCPNETSGSLEDPCDGERLGHGDEFETDYFNLSLKKETFLSCHRKANQNPLSKESWTDQKLCVKCNSNGDTLVCSTNNCPLIVHRCCLPSALSFDDKGHFYCPFCAYSSSIFEYLEAKKKASNARKELAQFIGMRFWPFTKELDGDNVHPSTVNNETVVHNQGEVERRMCEQNLLPDSSKSSEKPVNNETVIQNRGEVEGRIYEQDLLVDSSESSEKPVCAVSNESDKTSSDADTNKFIISYHSVGSRTRKRQYTYPATTQLRRNKIKWTTEEEEILKKGVQRFVGAEDTTIPWTKILEFGASVFLEGRTAVDLKDKWRNMCRAKPRD